MSSTTPGPLREPRGQQVVGHLLNWTEDTAHPRHGRRPDASGLWGKMTAGARGAVVAGPAPAPAPVQLLAVSVLYPDGTVGLSAADFRLEGGGTGGSERGFGGGEMDVPGTTMTRPKARPSTRLSRAFEADTRLTTRTNCNCRGAERVDPCNWRSRPTRLATVG